VGPDAPAQLVRQVRATIAAIPSGLLAFRTRCVLTVDVRAELARCAMPILYVRGTDDRLVRDKSVDEIVAAASVPVSIARIPGPHLILSTSPCEVWRAVGDFLARSVSS
jgi:pimeloyl-ACP methyl ester carboxylesterase